MSTRPSDNRHDDNAAIRRRMACGAVLTGRVLHRARFIGYDRRLSNRLALNEHDLAGKPVSTFPDSASRAVVRMTGQNGSRPINLLQKHDANHLMWPCRAAER